MWSTCDQHVINMCKAWTCSFRCFWLSLWSLQFIAAISWIHRCRRQKIARFPLTSPVARGLPIFGEAQDGPQFWFIFSSGLRAIWCFPIFGEAQDSPQSWLIFSSGLRAIWCFPKFWTALDSRVSERKACDVFTVAFESDENFRADFRLSPRRRAHHTTRFAFL